MIKTLEHTDLTTLHGRIREEIRPNSRVLDVGAGLAKYHEILRERGAHVTLVEAHKPYLDDRAKKFPAFTQIHGDAIQELTIMLQHHSAGYPETPLFDVALAIDFVEHLWLDDAKRVIGLMKGLAQRVIVFVPEGHHPQSHDGYGMGADVLQTHRSEWQARDIYDLGFEVERWMDFHTWTRGRTDPGALWATWEARK